MSRITVTRYGGMLSQSGRRDAKGAREFAVENEMSSPDARHRCLSDSSYWLYGIHSPLLTASLAAVFADSRDCDADSAPRSPFPRALDLDRRDAHRAAPSTIGRSRGG